MLSGLKRQIELLATYEEFQTNFVDNRLNPFLNQYVDGLSVLETGSEKMRDRYATPPPSLDSSIRHNRFTTSYQELLNDKTFSNQLIELYKHTNSLTKIYSRIGGLISGIDSVLIIENPSLKGDPLEIVE